MFKCFMNNHRNTMNACACAPVSAFACSCAQQQSADNNVILRILDAVFAVSIFVLAALANIIIILNEIIISLLAKTSYRPDMARA